MRRSIPVTLAMACLLPLAVSAQAHQHGGQGGGGMMPSDSSQGGMMQMHQQMQQHMAQMQEHMQAMQGMMQTMHGQQGMSGMGQASDLSTLLPGSGTDLALTDAQTSSLRAILEKARADALEVLTPEQRQRLGAAPAMADPRREDPPRQ